MVIVTGDTHGQFSKLNNKNTRDLLTSKDYVIVAGDFGLCWNRDKTFDYWLKFFEQREFTTLFIDGNHENFDMLDEYTVEQWHGGKVHHILKDKVIHLMRGQVFDIDDLSIFTFGGARSHDIQGGVLDRNDINFRVKALKAYYSGLPYRILGESWWEQEMPSKEEMEEGIRNLSTHNWQVDYVITHTFSNRVLPDMRRLLGINSIGPDDLTEYFEELEDKMTYLTWFSGHYHIDSKVDLKHKAIYHDMIQLY